MPLKINVIQAWKESVLITPGRPNFAGGEYAKKSLEAAVADLKTKAIDGLVTAPISKEILNKQGFFSPVYEFPCQIPSQGKSHVDGKG